MKHFKMVLYGEPGVGKSVFAMHAPKPYFITTDGNYEWLEEFGAKAEDHKEVSTWSEAKAEFAKDFSNYETIVVDLAEDLFKWCEYEFCTRCKFDHVSDAGYGKGYDITRNEYFIEICKLFAKEKNVILIMHGNTYVTKDRRGVEHTHHGPSSRMPDKLIDMIEGRVRYFLRCYLKGEEQSDGTLLKKRYLSLIPKENEFGICRGVNENSVPHDIPLDFNLFANAIGLNSNVNINNVESESETIEVPAKPKREYHKRNVEKAPEQVTIDNVTAETTLNNVEDELATETPPDEGKQIEEEKKTDTIPYVKPEVIPEPSKVETVEKPATQAPISNADKIAAIKAKLAALKNK